MACRMRTWRRLSCLSGSVCSDLDIGQRDKAFYLIPRVTSSRAAFGELVFALLADTK